MPKEWLTDSASAVLLRIAADHLEYDGEEFSHEVDQLCKHALDAKPVTEERFGEILEKVLEWDEEQVEQYAGYVYEGDYGAVSF